MQALPRQNEGDPMTPDITRAIEWLKGLDGWLTPPPWGAMSGDMRNIAHVRNVLPQLVAVVEAACESGQFEDHLFTGERPTRPGDARLFDALTALADACAREMK